MSTHETTHTDLEQACGQAHQLFLSKSLASDQFRIYPLAGDASNRRYFRVVSGSESFVLMCWEAFDPNNFPFLSIQQHFQENNILVPEIKAMDPEAGLTLLEDLGDLTLERKFWESQSIEPSVEFYRKSLDELIKIQFVAGRDPKKASMAFKVFFDTEKFMWEMNYAKDHLLKGLCKYSFVPKIEKNLEQAFALICQQLDAKEKYLCHRDYHSRNLMIKLDQVRVIDFQDARMGPLQYDLVSLLRDSYVDLSDVQVESFKEDYLDRAKDFLEKDFSREKFDAEFELQTTQRCLKACGSFASFYQNRGDTRYLKYISPTLKRVLKSLSLFPELRILTEVLIDSGALEQRFETS